MSKTAKKWLVAAGVLFVAGALIFTTVMTVYHWDFTRLSTEKFVTNTYEISGEFDSIKLDTETADIIFEKSSDNTCKVVCYEEEKSKHRVTTQSGILAVNFEEGKKWYRHIGFRFDTPKITVYLPKTEYASLVINGSTGDITIPGNFTFGSIDLSLITGAVDCRASSLNLMSIKKATGDIRLQSLSAGELDLAVTTGCVELQSVTCGSMSTKGSTGDILLKDVRVKEKLYAKRSTGDVYLEKCDAGEFDISTDTGDVIGSLMSPKLFIAHSDTGYIDVPETTSGGNCKVTTDTGDIRISVN